MIQELLILLYGTHIKKSMHESWFPVGSAEIEAFITQTHNLNARK